MRKWEYLRGCRNRSEDTAEGLNAPVGGTVPIAVSRDATHRPVSDSNGVTGWYSAIQICDTMLQVLR
jgi:hypothetical protein